MKIGVTAPGSSTHFMVLHMMAQAGLKPDDASFVGVGAGPTAVAAAKRGEIDALVSVDPVINLLQSENAIRQIVADTRTMEGTQAVYGGPYPAAVLYLSPAYAQSNPKTVQALTNAFVRGLKWIASHPAEDIAKAMPAGIRARQHGPIFIRSIRSSIPMYSPDGRFSPGSAETALKVLREFDDGVRAAPISTSRRPTPTIPGQGRGQVGMSNEPQIAIDGVSHMYRPPRGKPVLALEDISLEVAAARVRGAARPVGLRQVDAALSDRRLPADREAARIAVDGAPVKAPGPDRGIVFQHFALFPWKTVRGNILYGLERQGMPKAEREARAQALHRSGRPRAASRTAIRRSSPAA